MELPAAGGGVIHYPVGRWHHRCGLGVGVEQVPYLALIHGVALLTFSNLYALLVDRWPKPRLLPVLLLIYGLLLGVVRGLIAWGQIPVAIYAFLYVLRWQMFFLLGISSGRWSVIPLPSPVPIG